LNRHPVSGIAISAKTGCICSGFSAAGIESCRIKIGFSRLNNRVYPVAAAEK
jgi:hypothetical protein